MKERDLTFSLYMKIVLDPAGIATLINLLKGGGGTIAELVKIDERGQNYMKKGVGGATL